MQGRRIPAAPVSKASDLYADEHLKAREFFVPLPVREAGRRPDSRARRAFQGNRHGMVDACSGARLGEHNREVLGDAAARSTRSARNGAGSSQRAATVAVGPLHGVRSARFLLGVGRTVLHFATRPPGRRGDPDRNRQTSLRRPHLRAPGRRQDRAQPRRQLQREESQQAERAAQPGEARERSRSSANWRAIAISRRRTSLPV